MRERVSVRGEGGGCVYHSVSEEGSEPVHLTLPLIVMKGRVSASIRPL